MAADADAMHQHDRPPRLVRLLDDIVLLFAAGMVIPTAFYIVLGLISLLNVPQFAP